MGPITAPFFQAALEIFGQWGSECHGFAGGGVFETQALGVECLPWQQRKAVLDELFVLAEYRPFYYPVTTINGVVKQRMAYRLQVGANLVGTTGFQLAFD